MSRIISFEQSRNSLNTTVDVVLFSNVPSYEGSDSFHISIKNKSGQVKPEDKGNIFVGEYSDVENKKEIRDAFTFVWLKPNSLKITYSKSLKVINQKNKSHGVSILYEEK